MAVVLHEISPGNPADNLAHVRVTIPVDRPVHTFSFPVWTPGHYRLDNPQANVQDVAAEDGSGNPLEVVKTGLADWTVATAGSNWATLTYRVHLASPGPTGSELNQGHLYFHPTDLLPVVDGDLDRPQRLILRDLPEGWRAATGLPPCPDGDGWCADEVHHLMDSPFEVSDWQELTYESGGATFHIVFSGHGGPWPLDAFDFAADFKAFTDAQVEIFGGEAPGGISDYWWLLFPSAGGGGGLEHRASTTIGMRQGAFEGDKGNYDSLISVSSHELFHAWNVKRIRPAEMVPYIYDGAAPTTLLWVSEGFTSYYGRLARVRGGNLTTKEYLDGLAGAVRSVANSRGRPHTSPALSSLDTWIGSGTAREQRAISYYTTGEVLGFMMEAKLREDSGGTASVDEMMRWLYAEKWDGGAGPGFTEADLVYWLEARVEGHQDWEGFFRRWVRGGEQMPLAEFPWSLVVADASTEENPDVGMNMGNSWPFRISHVYPEGAAAAAGLTIGDEIVALNGEKATSSDLSDLEEEGTVLFFRRGYLLETTFMPGTRETWKLTFSLPEEEPALSWAKIWLAIPEPDPEPEGEPVEEGEGGEDAPAEEPTPALAG